MRFTLELKELKRLITRARPAVGTASSADAYKHVFLHVASDGEVTLTATDGELTAFVSAAATDTEPGEAIVLFSELAAANGLKGARTTVAAELLGSQLQLTQHDTDEQRTATVATTWVPLPVRLRGGEPVDLALLAFCISAAGSEEPEVPAGVLVADNSVVSTNGYLLAAVEGAGSSAGPTVLPAALVKAAVRAKAPATLAVADNAVQLNAAEASYQASADGGTFPQWEHLLPAEDAPTLDGVDAAALADLAARWTKHASSERLAPTMVLHHGTPVRCTLQLDELVTETLDGTNPGDLAVAPEQLKQLLADFDQPELLVPAPATGETGGLLIARERRTDSTWLRLLQQHVCTVDHR